MHPIPMTSMGGPFLHQFRQDNMQQFRAHLEGIKCCNQRRKRDFPHKGGTCALHMMCGLLYASAFVPWGRSYSQLEHNQECVYIIHQQIGQPWCYGQRVLPLSMYDGSLHHLWAQKLLRLISQIKIQICLFHKMCINLGSRSGGSD